MERKTELEEGRGSPQRGGGKTAQGKKGNVIGQRERGRNRGGRGAPALKARKR